MSAARHTVPDGACPVTVAPALTNGNIGIDHIFDVITHFFTKTCWTRTFHLIHGYPLK